MKRIVLASRSPRRTELMKYITEDFTAVSPDVEESFIEGASWEDNAMHVSYLKAKAVSETDSPEYDVIIAADTTVVLDDEVMGKPSDEADAKRMLSMLSGRTHSVYTGVCIITKKRTLTFCEETLVTFRRISDREMDDYIATGEPMDKAGAYGIQGRGRIFVEKIDGNYENVMGLPLTRLMEVLSGMGGGLLK
ncbi:MAG: septum formation protein Maf [Eubacteriaceae bacterium]|nr:septum formation protein Maf [Eubacteriaceae bacterium]